MTYLQDRKKRQTAIITKTIIVLVIVLVVFGISKVKEYVGPTTSNLFSFSNSISKNITQNKLLVYFSSKNNLKQENEDLKKQISTLQQKNNELDLIAKENEDFRAILNVPSIINNPKTLVQSLGDSYAYGTIIIDAGTNKKIKKSDVLVGSKGGMVGVVTEVYQNTAQVLLIDRSKVPLVLFSLDSQLELDAYGNSRGILSADLPRDTVIEIGETLVMRNNLNILVGRVADIKGDERNPFKQVFIRLEDQYKYSPYLYIVHQ